MALPLRFSALSAVSLSPKLVSFPWNAFLFFPPFRLSTYIHMPLLITLLSLMSYHVTVLRKLVSYADSNCIFSSNMQIEKRPRILLHAENACAKCENIRKKYAYEKHRICDKKCCIYKQSHMQPNTFALVRFYIITRPFHSHFIF